MVNLSAEVPFMAEGLFLSISRNVNGNAGKAINANIEKHIQNVKGSIKTNKRKADIEGQVIAPTVEKLCKCRHRAAIYDFGEIENGKSDWTFYCNKCNSHIYCRECGNRAIPYVNFSGKHILNKCNVHGARLKVTHAEIEAWSREKERNRNSNTDGDNQSRIPF